VTPVPRAFIALPVALALCAGCSMEGPVKQPDAGGFMPLNPDPRVVMAGYVLDPEALFFSIRMCDRFGPGSCPLPSQLLTGMPHLMRSLVPLGKAQVFDPDPAVGKATLDGGTWASASGGPPAAWVIGGVTRRDSPPYYVYVSRAIPGTPPAQPYDAGFAPPPPAPYMPPIPTAWHYLPTRSAVPIHGNAAGCYGIRTPIMGDTGVLDALAQYLTATGGTTVVPADLLNPSLFGGVAVVWVYQPSDRNSILAAPGIPVEVLSGPAQLYTISWSNPAAAPPPEADAGNGLGFSARGFYVNPYAPVSNAGVYVLTVPPNGGSVTTATNVAVAATDPSLPDAGPWRPYRYQPQTLDLRPAQIMFVEYKAVPNYPYELGEWECYE